MLTLYIIGFVIAFIWVVYFYLGEGGAITVNDILYAIIFPSFWPITILLLLFVFGDVVLWRKP